ncbi:MAG TPA: TetR/AcrR family transcriptional regulator [Thermoleophilaceae bacterium]|nr:TetR/AcrR family transcriptional regulator [Thermoleophilaceae bacterium]
MVDSQRERVLAAMRELVAGRGFQDVPVAEVIRRAGVSRKTFYELYASKEECFVALYDQELERLLFPTLQAFQGTESWVDRLRTALGVLLGALAADPAAARLCFVEVLSAGPKALARRNGAMAKLDPLFDRANVSTAVGSTRPRAVTAGAVGYLSEVLNREIAAGRTTELPELRAELMYTLTLPFVGPHNAGKELAREGVEGDVTADAASERSFLTAYGAHAADLLGRVSAAMARVGAAGDGSADGASYSGAGVAADAADRVRAGVAAVLEFCAEEPDGARACFVEALSVGPAARERRAETTRRLSELFEQPLRELRPSERIARVSAIALVGGMLELLFDPVDRRAVDELPSLDAVVAAARLEPDPQR